MTTNYPIPTAEQLRGGYSEEQLEQAFALVRPVSHWKDPISAEVPADTDMNLLCFAVSFFTGSIPEVYQIDGGFLVEADGYYASIGA